MITAQEIKDFAIKSGADLCGIASIDTFSDSPQGFHPADIYPAVRSIISVACKIPEMPLHIQSPSPYSAIEELVLSKVSQIAFAISVFLDKNGFHAVLIPSIPYDFWDPETLTGRGILSLKHLAYKAGLGYIGKNSLLCNEKYGNLIKLGAVITNAELIPDKIIESTFCEDSCQLCIDSCPVGAIGTDTMVSQRLCRTYSETKNKRGVEIYVCHECRKVCPNRNGY